MCALIWGSVGKILGCICIPCMPKIRGCCTPVSPDVEVKFNWKADIEVTGSRSNI